MLGAKCHGEVVCVETERAEERHVEVEQVLSQSLKPDRQALSRPRSVSMWNTPFFTSKNGSFRYLPAMIEPPAKSSSMDCAARISVPACGAIAEEEEFTHR